MLYFEVYLTGLRRERIESAGFAKEFFDKGGTQEKELTRINDYSFANDAAARAGLVSIPIEQAMQKVVARYPGKN